MAHLPIPIGVGDMLLDIAEGLAGAARSLPAQSRSAVGAVAMSKARVTVDFELSCRAQRTEKEVGAGPLLGVKTFQFGFTNKESESLHTGSNRGHIEFEVVAVLDPAPAEEPARLPPRNPPVVHEPAPARKLADGLRQQIASLHAREVALVADPADKRSVAALLKQADQLVSAERLDDAAAAIAAAENLLDRPRGKR